MGKRKQPVTRDQIIAAAAAMIACAGAGMPQPLQTIAWSSGLAILAWAMSR